MSTSDWPEISLDGDWESGCEFWQVVLKFAAADDAAQVEFDPAQGEDCIVVTVGADRKTMVSPPVELLPALLFVAQRLVAGDSWLGRLKALAVRYVRLQIQRELKVEDTLWSAEAFHDRIVFWRLAGPVASK